MCSLPVNWVSLGPIAVFDNFLLLRLVPVVLITTMTASEQQLKIDLHYDTSIPPTAALFCLSLPRDKKNATVELLADHRGCFPQAHFTLQGKTVVNEASDLEISRLICLSLPNCRSLIDFAPENFPSHNNFQSSVHYWMEFAINLENSFPASTHKPLLSTIENHLKLRTFIVGHQLTLADVLLYSVIGKFFGFSNLGVNSIETGKVEFSVI